ncbi:AAA family ATPase [Inquilinus sp. NPDC058860]|uniref:AAA family ATPase n=1 Tax=Inquilinus sp. NPDC058860 TaxID=3346652 RepID=UPI003675F4C5
MYLAEIRRRPGFAPDGRFPWTIPVVAGLERLAFTAPVTFLVGENGCGKSTLIEGLAAGMGAYAVGSVQEIRRDPMLAAARRFAEGLLFVRRRHPRVKMFLRAEDVFGHVKAQLTEADELEAEAREIRDDPEGSEAWKQKSGGLLAGMAAAIRASDPDGRSHGESFLSILQRRVHGAGLYFLDEPETPLSPTRQLALLRLLHDAAEAGAQLIVATHSPILMALPGAAILEIRDGRIGPVAYDTIEHVAVTRRFLADPARMLKALLD